MLVYIIARRRPYARRSAEWGKGGPARVAIEERCSGERPVVIARRLEKERVTNHAGGNGGIRDFVDEDKAARDAVLAVVVDDERVSGLQRGEPDVVGGKRVGLVNGERF